MLTNSLIPDTAVDTLLILAAGTAAIAAIGYLAAERLRPPAWQRAVWQMVLLAVAGLTAAELAGLSSCVSYLVATGQSSRHAPRAVPALPSASQIQQTVMSVPRELTVSPLPESADGRRSVPATFTLHVGESLRDSHSPLEETQPHGASGRVERDSIDNRAQNTVGDVATTRELAAIAEPNPATADLANRASPDADDSPGSASWRSTIGHWLVIVWVIGVVLLAALRAGVGSLLLWRFCRRLRPLSDDALSWSVYVISRRLGMRRPVRLREAAGLAAPMAWGVARPTVALPPGFADDYGPQEQQAMLAHELAHLRGADPLWQRLADWLTVILWWHPAAWWTRRQWQAASERSADEASLVVDGGPELLAECLVQLGGRVSGARPLGWVGMRGGFRSHLGRRVERLLSLGHERWRPPGRLLWAKALVPVAAVAAAILCTSWARSETSYHGETDMKMVQHYWRQSVLGVALVATLSAADRALATDTAFADDAAAVAAAQDPDRPPAAEPERRDDDRPKGGRRDGDRPGEGAKREGDRPQPRDAERRDGPRPQGDGRDGDRPGARAGERRDDPRPKGERRDGDRPRPEEGDQDRQLRHLKAAADNLEAAGRHEEAERLRREITERTRKGGGDRPGVAPGRAEGGSRPGPQPPGSPAGSRPGPQAPGGPPDLMRVIGQLQEEVAQLRREMAEMRRLMPGLRDGQPGERGGPRGLGGEGRPGNRPGAEGPPKFDRGPERGRGGDDRPREGDGPRKERPRGDNREEGDRDAERAPPPKERE